MKNYNKETNVILSKNYKSGEFEEEFYKQKYFKYKSKYSALKTIKSIQKGGDKPPTPLQLSHKTELELKKIINDHSEDIDYIIILKKNLETVGRSQIQFYSEVKEKVLDMINLCEDIIIKDRDKTTYKPIKITPNIRLIATVFTEYRDSKISVGYYWVGMDNDGNYINKKIIDNVNKLSNLDKLELLNSLYSLNEKLYVIFLKILKNTATKEEFFNFIEELNKFKIMS